MAANNDLRWHWSGGAGNTDPDASLGGARATATIYDTAGTFTSTGAVGDIHLFDNALGGSDDDHNGKFLHIVDGAGELETFLIEDYRASDGRFILETPLTTTVGIGDNYRLFPVNAVFDDKTALECAVGDTEYRGIYLFNASAQNLDNVFFWFKMLDFSNLNMHGVSEETSATLDVIADESTEPPIATIDAASKWVSPRSFSQGFLELPVQDNPPGVQFTLSNNNHRGLWLRRTTPVNSRRRSRAAMLVVAEGFDVSQIRAACVVVFDLDGFTPTITVTHDRSARIGGGARFTGEVRAQETGLVVPNLELGWEVTTGPGTIVQDEAPVTDENGLNSATYVSPTDQGDAGTAVTVSMKV